MRLVCISDTHGYHPRVNVPEGDLLIHSGDFTRLDSYEELAEFDEWLEGQPHPFKVVVAGNHDWCFQKKPEWSRKMLRSSIYLQDSEHTIGGLKFYGSPWQPEFCNWAFNLPRDGKEIQEKWNSIPKGSRTAKENLTIPNQCFPV